MKLSYRIFAVHILVSVLLLTVGMFTLRYFALSHFRQIEDKLENHVLTVLSDELAMAYQKDKSWDKLSHPLEFGRFINQVLEENRPHYLLLPPPPPKRQPGPPGPTGPDGFKTPKKPPPIAMILVQEKRLGLYDAQKERLAGPPIEPEKQRFWPIALNDCKIGWIGYQKLKKPPVPQPELKQKLQALYTIGFIAFIMAGIVSYFLSRHILSPVRRLTKGTKDLTQFKFDSRIDVKTTDELGVLAQDFNTMAKTLDGYEKMSKQWVVDISHELRTPLSILRGEMEAIQDGIRQPSEAVIESLYTEVRYLETIVNDLHLLSMADSETLAMTKKPVQPIKILQNLLALFDTRLAARKLSLDVTLNHPNTRVIGDPDRLKQLFVNILENNIRYSEKSGTLKIRDQIEENTLFIVIEDTGPGVPPDSIHKIFDRLYRVDKSRSRKDSGSGLGLSICKTIAKAHGGDIHADNLPNSGLGITLTLPKV